MKKSYELLFNEFNQKHFFMFKKIHTLLLLILLFRRTDKYWSSRLPNSWASFRVSGNFALRVSGSKSDDTTPTTETTDNSTHGNRESV